MNQWFECLTRPALEVEVSGFDWIIALCTRNKKDDGDPDPSIHSWAQQVGSLKELLKKRCNLKWALVLCPYIWPNGLKGFSSGTAHKGRKDYQGVINNTYHGGHIETKHHII